VTKLDSALAWAARGFPVFPLVENGKDPLPGSNGHLDATTDPARINAMWRDYTTGGLLEYNIGCSPRDGRHVIVDLDVKDARNGIGNYLALGGEIDGLVVRTPSGGLHVYLSTPRDTKNTIGEIAVGIDTRGSGGYGVAPGSIIDGVAYEVIQDDPILPAPKCLLDVLPEPGSRSILSSTYAVEDDLPANVARAVETAKRAAPAFSGVWHAEGFKLGCEMARIGVSQETAWEILFEHWVPRGQGFKSRDQFERDVAGGYQESVSAGEHGSYAAPDVSIFTKMGITPPPPDTVPVLDTPALPDLFTVRTWGQAREERGKHVPYIIKNLLGPGDIGAVLGESGSGKSVVLPYLAYCVALGQPFFGRRVKQGRVLYFAAENGEGLERRLQALGDAMGDPGDRLLTVIEDVNLSGGERDMLQRFADTINYYEADLAIVDTLFAAFPETDVTEHGEMGASRVVNIARACTTAPRKPALVFGHHVPKGGGIAYGGQKLQAMFDTTLFIEGELKQNRKVVVRKNRRGPDGDKYEFRIASAEICKDQDGDPVTAATVEVIDLEARDSDLRAAHDSWLAETNTGARTVMDTLTRLCEAAGEASPSDRACGLAFPRVTRSDLLVGLQTYGFFETDQTPARKERQADHLLSTLKEKGFVGFDTAYVWVMAR
jgi:hypothetical protein